MTLKKKIISSSSYHHSFIIAGKMSMEAQNGLDKEFDRRAHVQCVSKKVGPRRQSVPLQDLSL